MNRELAIFGLAAEFGVEPTSSPDIPRGQVFQPESFRATLISPQPVDIAVNHVTWNPVVIGPPRRVGPYLVQGETRSLNRIGEWVRFRALMDAKVPGLYVLGVVDDNDHARWVLSEIARLLDDPSEGVVGLSIAGPMIPDADGAAGVVEVVKLREISVGLGTEAALGRSRVLATGPAALRGWTALTDETVPVS